MADFLHQLYLELHNLLPNAITPRERKFIEIITQQNRALEDIANNAYSKSPQEIVLIAKASILLIAEKGAKTTIPISQYINDIMAKAAPPPAPPEAPAKPFIVPRKPEESSTVGGGLYTKQKPL